jgi:hypothetical protein
MVLLCSVAGARLPAQNSENPARAELIVYGFTFFAKLASVSLLGMM